MKQIFVFFFLLATVAGKSQQTRDTTLSRCPIFITDTITGNNFFIEGRNCILKVYKLNNNLRIQIEQKDQFFTLIFNIGKLKSTKYDIRVGSTSRGDVAAKYSFKSGDQVSYIDVVKGAVTTKYNKEKKMWQVNVDGLIADLGERGVSYYKAKADFWIK